MTDMTREKDWLKKVPVLLWAAPSDRNNSISKALPELCLGIQDEPHLHRCGDADRPGKHLVLSTTVLVSRPFPFLLGRASLIRPTWP